MILMRNKYLNFNNIEFKDNLVKNYTEVNMLPDIPEKYFSGDYLLELKLEDDRFLEGISLELWGSTDYWDILMKFNGMTRMDILPVNYDAVLGRALDKFEIWKSINILSNTALSQTTKDEKYQDIVKEEEETNETYRILKYVSVSDLSELLADLDKLKTEPKIPSGLIINSSDESL